MSQQKSTLAMEDDRHAPSHLTSDEAATRQTRDAETNADSMTRQNSALPKQADAEKTGCDEGGIAECFPDKSRWWYRRRGLLLALMSTVLMTSYTTMIKLLDQMDSMQVVVMRGVMQLVLMGTISLVRRHSFGSHQSWRILLILALVAITGGLRLLFSFVAVSKLPLGDSTAILFSSPVFVMLFSVCVLRERCEVLKVVCSGFLIAGVILVSHPPVLFGDPVENYESVGYILVSLACLASAIGIVFTKKISKKVEDTVITFYLGLLAAVCGAIGLCTVGHPSNPPAWEWGLSIGISVLGIGQQYCFISAVRSESPSTVTVIRQLQIILAYILQVAIFGMVPRWSSILGAAFILTTIIVLTCLKQETLVAAIKRVLKVANNNAKDEEKAEKAGCSPAWTVGDDNHNKDNASVGDPDSKVKDKNERP